MKDIIIAAAVAVVFVIGFFIIRWLDKALAESSAEKDEKKLRIGINDTETSEALADALDTYSELYPLVSIKLVNANADRLLKELSSGGLDVVFLSGEGVSQKLAGLTEKKLMLSHTPVTMKYGGLPIESISEEMLGCEVLWREQEKERHILDFIGGLWELSASA